MTDFVSVRFVAMIPIDCKITKIFLTLVIIAIAVKFYVSHLSCHKAQTSASDTSICITIAT